MSQSQEQQSIDSATVSRSIDKYVKLVSRSNKNTGKQYLSRLKRFEQYCIEVHKHMLDDFLVSKEFQIDVYELLSGFVSYLIDRNTHSNQTIKQSVTTARNLLEYYDTEVSPRKFRFKVIIPKPVVKHKEALTRETIIQILEACPNPRLKIYVLWLAATGMRAGEACSIRMQDLDLGNRKVYVQGEHTKTKIDRWTFLTKELCEALLSWFEYKYRPRKKYHAWDNERKQYIKLREPAVFVPARSETDLTFGLEFENKKMHKGPGQQQSIKVLYNHLVAQFDKVLDRLGVGYEDAARKRRKITLHSFRRWVKSTISDLGYSDFSEWYIGHAVSTYYRKSDKEKFQLFNRLEESLTYLDQSSLERRHADVLSRLEMVESENLGLQRKIRDREMALEETQTSTREDMASMADMILELQKQMDELRKEKGRDKEQKQ